MQRAVIQPVLFAAFVVISISMVITGAITSQTLKLYVLGFPFMHRRPAGWAGYLSPDSLRPNPGVALFSPARPLALDNWHRRS